MKSTINFNTHDAKETTAAVVQTEKITDSKRWGNTEKDIQPDTFNEWESER